MKTFHSLPQALAHPARIAGGILCITLVISSCATQTGDSASRSGRGGIDFQEDVRPVFEMKCLECHNSRINHGGLILETRTLAFRPRPGGPVIVPGNPKASRITSVIQLPEELSDAMPPTRHRLTRDQVRMLTEWIEAGADWPAGEDGRLYPPAEKYPYPPDSHPALRG